MSTVTLSRSPACVWTACVVVPAKPSSHSRVSTLCAAQPAKVRCSRARARAAPPPTAALAAVTVDIESRAGLRQATLTVQPAADAPGGEVLARLTGFLPALKGAAAPSSEAPP